MTPSPEPVALAPRVTSLAASSPIPLGGALVLLTFGLVVIALGMTTLATVARSVRHTTPTGGSAMSSTRRWRLITGGSLLALSAIVGVIGWLKISDEPALNRQVPYFASTGLAVVILAVAGGAMLVAEQMRTDDRRLDDIEDAVRTLAAAMAPTVEKPARLRDPEPAEVVTAVTSKPRAPRKTARKSPAKSASR